MSKKSFFKNRRVLVTGHKGFLGSWLVRGLVKLGAKVVGVDKVIKRPVSILNDLSPNITSVKGDIAGLKFISGVIKTYRPETIFHLAAEAIVVEANKNPVRTFRSNIEGTWNLLEASRDKKFIEEIIIASSDKAYGTHNALPYKEEAALKGAHPYDVSKSCADLLAYAYHNTYDVPVCTTRCGNIFGPGDFHFSRIVPDTIRAALSGRQLLIRSNGKFTRDYIYMEDIVYGYLLLAQRFKTLGLSGEAFNFSMEAPISVLELAKRVYRLCGKRPDYKILNIARHEIKDQYLSAKKARDILGWRPRYTLEEGLVETIEWYKNWLGKKR